MSDTMKISVILTSYNKSKFIGKAIESVLTQTYKELELIIVDDGSKDDSREVIEGYAHRDNRIKPYFFEENKGIPSAHNYAIEKAQGEYCAMIDCDDFWEPDKLEKQLEILETHQEYGACFTWIRVVDEDEEKVSSEECEFRDVMWNSENHTQGEWLRIFFTEGCKLGNPSMMVRKKVLEEVGYYSYGLKQLQDYDLFIRILKAHNVYILSEKLVNYRWFRGEVKNTSFDNIESASRSNFEYYLICMDFFTNIKYEIFKQGFGEYIKNKCVTEEDIVCEQVFITKEHFLVPVIGRMVAMENIFLLINNTYFREVLERRYQINSTSFAEEIKETIFFDEKYYVPKDEARYGKELEEKIDKLKREWYQAVEYNKELISTVEELESYKGELENYKKELEENSSKQSDLIQTYVEQIDTQKNYIKELQGCKTELEEKSEKQSQIIQMYTDQIKVQKQYVGELEDKVKEISELYVKCNDYAMTLETRIRDMGQ